MVQDELDARLWAAFGENDNDDVLALLAQGANPRVLDAYGNTLAHMAAAGNWPDCLGELRRAGVDLSGINDAGQTPAHVAAAAGYVHFLRGLSADGVSLHAQDAFGATPAHCAATAGYAGVIRFLLINGADVNARDAHGNTLAHSAAQAGAIGCLHVVLQAGADLRLRNDQGLVPLQCARAHRREAAAAYLQASRSKRPAKAIHPSLQTNPSLVAPDVARLAHLEMAMGRIRRHLRDRVSATIACAGPVSSVDSSSLGAD